MTRTSARTQDRLELEGDAPASPAGRGPHASANEVAGFEQGITAAAAYLAVAQLTGSSTVRWRAAAASPSPARGAPQPSHRQAAPAAW